MTIIRPLILMLFNRKKKWLKDSCRDFNLFAKGYTVFDQTGKVPVRHVRVEFK